jgi:gliding motility-associated-like protein
MSLSKSILLFFIYLVFVLIPVKIKAQQDVFISSTGFSSSSNEEELYFVDLKNCSTKKFDEIYKRTTDIAYNHLENKIYYTSIFGAIGTIDLSTTFKENKTVGNPFYGVNALSFDKKGNLFAAAGYSIYKLNPADNYSPVLMGVLDTIFGFSSGDLAFLNDKMYLATTKGYIIEIDTTQINKSKIVYETGLLDLYGLSSSCGDSLFLYASNDIYVIDINIKNSITTVCENITPFSIGGASSVFENEYDVKILGESKICPNKSQESLLKTDSHFSNYQWSTGDTSNQISVQDTGTYWVKQRNVCGESADTIHLTYRDLPAIEPLDTSAKCFPLAIKLDSTYKLEWYNQSTANEIQIEKAGDYWLKINDGFCTDTTYFSVSAAEGSVEHPNTITPNKDGKNDFFQILEDQQNPIQLEIYNRWGKEIYRSEDYQNNWPQTEISTGVYFYRSQTGDCLNSSWIEVLE